MLENVNVADKSRQPDANMRRPTASVSPDQQFPFWPEYQLFQSKLTHVVYIFSAHYSFDGRKIRRHLPSRRFELGADQRKQAVPACIPRTRLQRGELFADIIEDRR